MNDIGYFEIQADDTQRAAGFYNKVFGWRFKEERGLPVEYWRIEGAGTRGGLLKRPAHVPDGASGTNAFTCSIQVRNFDITAEKVRRLGGQVAMEKFAVPGRCWQGYFVDCEGNTFGIFQLDKKAR